MVKTYPMFLLVLFTFVRHVASRTSKIWPDGSGDAPFARVQFFERTCKCRSDLNETIGGCFNMTSGFYENEICSDEPYWGIVFVWWAFAAFLIGAATATGIGTFGDVMKELCLLGSKKAGSTQIHNISTDPTTSLKL